MINILQNLFNPKIDIVFKLIFGNENNTDILISFLNSILKWNNIITKVELKGLDFAMRFKEDSCSRIGVKATTLDGEIVNIEIQFKNEYSMTERSIHQNIAELYEELVEEKDFGRVVFINILNFKYLTTKRFHTIYRFREIETNEQLTDTIEIHFIEIPKLIECDEDDMLGAWVEFLKNPDSEKVRKLEVNINEIRRAKDELIKLSSDKSKKSLYEMRRKTLLDIRSSYNNLIEEKCRLILVEEVKRLVINNEIHSSTIDEIEGYTTKELKSILLNR